MKTVLFLCTGNYYRSRFAEYYFRHLATEHNLAWAADSRGLLLDPGNLGPMSRHTRAECEQSGICMEPLRLPQTLSLDDLKAATRVVAVKQTEHRPLMHKFFPEWVEKVEYWEVHDVDFAPPSWALPQLRQHVEELVQQLRGTPEA